jgi:hypothetical protein
MTADDLIERYATTGPICAVECRRALFFLRPRYQFSVSRVPKGCRHKRPYIFHRIALLWSNRTGGLKVVDLT